MKKRIEIRRRISRLNKCILLLVLLWIATFATLLFEAHENGLHAAQHEKHGFVQMATLRGTAAVAQTGSSSTGPSPI